MDLNWLAQSQESPEPGSLLMSLVKSVGEPLGGKQPLGMGGGPVPMGGSPEAIARRMALKRFGWGGGQWDALHELVSRESGWDPDAQNPTSTASELFQFLDSTAANYGLDPEDNPLRPQIRAGLKYIRQRYGDPQSALRFHDQNNWY